MHCAEFLRVKCVSVLDVNDDWDDASPPPLSYTEISIAPPSGSNLKLIIILFLINQFCI